MKTIANEYKEYITEETIIGGYGLELAAYTFKNGYQARVLEEFNPNFVSLVIVKFDGGKSSLKDMLFQLTPEQLIEKLEEIKNYA
ncbi:hypothetical protein OYI72_002598 [Listeria innocua]|nr:hypothetical protein [Listeria innocua]EKF1876111.1 hypothetical protein [Listeria innocua]EKF1884894.1 hypothetical protein [Listeria innocua]